MEYLRFLLVVVLIVPGYSLAESFDGSKPLTCALRNVTECQEVDGCKTGPPSNINAPTFIHFDFKAMTLNGTRTGQSVRRSKIKRKERFDGQLYLQGTDKGAKGSDGGFAWSVAITEKSGEMALSVVGDGVGFIVFGACIHS